MSTFSFAAVLSLTVFSTAPRRNWERIVIRYIERTELWKLGHTDSVDTMPRIMHVNTIWLNFTQVADEHRLVAPCC
jgi:hypothetical protein